MAQKYAGINGLLSAAEAAQSAGLEAAKLSKMSRSGLVRTYGPDRLYDPTEVAYVLNKPAVRASGMPQRPFTTLKSKANGLTTIDLFAGAGGTALGLSNAGFEHLLVNEFNKDAADALKRNRPDWNVVHADVSEVDFRPYRGLVDVVEGGFPCQAFSTTGKSLGFEDTRGTLFYQWARAIKETMPKVAIGENVRGLIGHDGGKTLRTMIRALQDIKDENGVGYKVAWKLLRAQFMDVAQKRERLIIIVVREDLASPILFPREDKKLISVWEALHGVPDSPGSAYSARKKAVMDLVPAGGNWRDLPDDVQRDYMGAAYGKITGGKTSMAGRLSWDEPSWTIMCSPAQKQTERCHPGETRPLTVRESARLQSFPDEWDFYGGASAQYKQVGNAVPVNMGYHLGRAATAIITGIDQDMFDVVEPLLAA